MSTSAVSRQQKITDERVARGQIMADPLCAAPPELEQDIFRLWACVQHLFPSPLPIAGLVRVWVDLHGLTVADARAILLSMLSPDCVGSFKFAADLTAALASRVAERLKSIAKAAEVERVRQLQAKRDAESPPKERGSLMKLFQDRAAEVGSMPTDDKPGRRMNEAFVDVARGQ